MAKIEHEYGHKRITQIDQRGRPSKSELRSQRNKAKTIGTANTSTSPMGEPVRQLDGTRLVQVEPNGSVRIIDQ